MKNTAHLLFALTFATSLAACGGGGSDDGATTNATGDDAADDVADDAPGTTAGDDAADDAATDDAADDSPDTGADSGADDGGAMACTHTCAGDADCQVGGMDIGLICEDTSCVNGNPCATADDCVAQLSGWSFTPCTMGGGECAATMQVCVDLGDGTGGCASQPSEFVTCEQLGQSESQQTNLDDGSEVTVCANTSGECNTETGYCYVPCADDSTCGTLVCNTDTGMCECDSDDDCGEGGTCSAGVCSVPGCADDSECGDNPFDGGMYGCQ